MKEKPSYISLTQYFKGEASEADINKIKAWGEVNKDEFNQLQSIWDKYGSLATSYTPDLSKAWDKIDERTQSSNGTSFRWITRIAAVLVVVIGVGWMLQSGWLSASSPLQTYQATNENLVVDLVDQTSVTLSPGSSLTTEAGFGLENRRVELTGKGFFEVEKDESLPFVVNVGELNVSVLGTSFQVDQSADLIKVIVTEGKVDVRAADNVVVLNKYERAFFDRSASTLIKSDKINENQMAWKSLVLKFSNVTLLEFAEDLEDFYGIDIDVADGLQTRRITAEFNNQTLSEVFEIVQATLTVNIDTLDRSRFRIE